MSDVRDLIIIGGGPAGLHRGALRGAGEPRAARDRGLHWGGQLMITSDVENYPGYPDGVMGPEMMAEFRRQAERFGTEFVTDDVTAGRLLRAPVPRLGRGRRSTARNAVIVATGASARWLGLPGEQRLPGPRRLGLRDLRRRVLPRQGAGRRRRRRHRDGGGDVPHALRDAR